MFTRSVLHRQEKCSDKVGFRLTWVQRHRDITENILKITLLITVL